MTLVNSTSPLWSRSIYDCKTCSIAILPAGGYASGVVPLGSLSKDVFERRTCMATGNETFSLFTRLGATTFVILSVFTLLETIYLKTGVHPLPKNEKHPFPVAVRRSKTP